MIDSHNQDSSGVIMTSQVVNLQVTASIPIDCDFWPEDDGWKGLCKSLSVTRVGRPARKSRRPGRPARMPHNRCTLWDRCRAAGSHRSQDGRRPTLCSSWGGCNLRGRHRRRRCFCPDARFGNNEGHSCRNRHCPRCQGNARQRWLQARERELLPASYVHVVFTLPRELAPLALQNKRLIYNLLFHTSAATLLEIARDPRHLGAEIGFFSVLHTWDQRLQHHPHVHCVLAAGGLAPDHSRWISSRRSFFLPVKVLSRVFRGKFVAGLKAAFHAGTNLPRKTRLS